MADTVKIIIICRDDEEFECDKEIIEKASKVIADTIKETLNEEDTELKIPLKEITKDQMERIYKFMEQHRDKEIPVLKKPLRKYFEEYEEVKGWYLEYFDKQLDQLCDFINAGANLDYEPFVQLTAARLASFMRGKTTEEMREMFNIENDWDHDEYERVKNEDIWASDEDDDAGGEDYTNN